MMMAPPAALHSPGADEVVIETRDSLRPLIERDESQEAVPFGHLDAQKGEKGAG